MIPFHGFFGGYVGNAFLSEYADNAYSFLAHPKNDVPTFLNELLMLE